MNKKMCQKKFNLFITYININVFNKKIVEKPHHGTHDERDGQSDRHGLYIPCSDFGLRISTHIILIKDTTN
jgi:hypothetical protein